MAIFLRNAMRELKKGAPAEDIREALFAFSVPPDMELEFDDDEMGEEDWGDEYEEEVEPMEDPARPPHPDVLVSSSMGALPQGLRPLGPDEVPPNLTPEQRESYEGMGGDDQGIRAKLIATHARATGAVAHAERVAAMRERERAQLELQAEAEAHAPGNGKAGPATTRIAIQAAEDELDAMSESQEVGDTMALLDDMVSAPSRPENGVGAPIEVAPVPPAVTTSAKPKRRRKRKQA